MADILSFPYGDRFVGGRAPAGEETPGEPGGLLSDNLRPVGAREALPLASDGPALFRVASELPGFPLDTTDLARRLEERLSEFCELANDLIARYMALQDDDATMGDTWSLWQGEAINFLTRLVRQPASIRMAWPLTGMTAELHQLLKARNEHRFEDVDQPDLMTEVGAVNEDLKARLVPAPPKRTPCASPAPAPEAQVSARADGQMGAGSTISLDLELCASRFHAANAARAYLDAWVHAGRSLAAIGRAVHGAVVTAAGWRFHDPLAAIPPLSQTVSSARPFTEGRVSYVRAGVMRKDAGEFLPASPRPRGPQGDDPKGAA